MNPTAALPTILVAQPSGGSSTPSARLSTTFDAKAAAAADEKLTSLRDAVAKLKTVGDSAKSAGADLAKKKLDALKQRLKMLLMLGGDPKTVAKQAARIAKEIGQAAKDYADSAGGSDGGAAAEASSAATAAQQEAAAAQGGEGATQASDAEASNAKAGGPDPVASGEGSADAEAAKSPGASRTQPQGEDQTKAQPAIARGGSTVGKSRTPDPVIEEARVLEASAKAIAKAALEKLKAQHRHNPDAKAEQADLDQGEKDFNAAAKAIYGDAGVPTGAGGDVAGAYAADGSAAATPSPDTSLVSVKA